MMDRFTGGDIQKAIDLEPVGRLGKPEEIADAVLWMSCRPRRFRHRGINLGRRRLVPLSILYQDETEERSHGDQAQRSQPSGRARRLVHRHVRIDPLSSARPCGPRRRGRHLRAGRTHGLAHASARPDADRHRGLGWVQREGGPIEEIRPGDVVWFEPGEKHWHGATASTAMTHIAIPEALDGKAVDLDGEGHRKDGASGS